MGDMKISQLSDAQPLNGSELIPVVQDGETKKAQAARVAATVLNAGDGTTLSLQPTGTQNNIDLCLKGKGNGVVKINTLRGDQTLSLGAGGNDALILGDNGVVHTTAGGYFTPAIAGNGILNLQASEYSGAGIRVQEDFAVISSNNFQIQPDYRTDAYFKIVHDNGNGRISNHMGGELIFDSSAQFNGTSNTIPNQGGFAEQTTTVTNREQAFHEIIAHAPGFLNYGPVASTPTGGDGGFFITKKSHMVQLYLYGQSAAGSGAWMDLSDGGCFSYQPDYNLVTFVPDYYDNWFYLAAIANVPTGKEVRFQIADVVDKNNLTNKIGWELVLTSNSTAYIAYANGGVRVTSPEFIIPGDSYAMRYYWLKIRYDSVSLYTQTSLGRDQTRISQTPLMTLTTPNPASFYSVNMLVNMQTINAHQSDYGGEVKVYNAGFISRTK